MSTIIKNFYRFLMLVLILGFSAGTSAVEGECKIPSEGYDLISIFPPDTAAGLELKKAEPRFLAVAGLTIEVPGVPGLEQCSPVFETAALIPGTTDAPCSEASDIFQIAARLYAAQFNGRLLRARPELAELGCPAQ